jgi:hypothetical protein
MKIAANGESRLISLAQPVILLNMPDEADYQEQPTSSAKSVRFVELSSAAMTALLDGSLADASSEAGIALTPLLPGRRAAAVAAARQPDSR